MNEAVNLYSSGNDMVRFAFYNAFSKRLRFWIGGKNQLQRVTKTAVTGRADAKSESLYKIAACLNMSMDSLYKALCIQDTSNKVDKESRDNMSEKYYFKVLYNSDKVDMRRVFPTKQLVVSKINQTFAGDKRLACIMLFGSSVTMKCNKDSDIDLLVRLNKDYITVETKNEISEKLQEICDWNADIIWYDRISPKERIYKNILKGVQIV